MSNQTRVRNKVTGHVGYLTENVGKIQGRVAVMYDGETVPVYTFSVFLEKLPE